MVKCGNEISALLTTRPRGPPWGLGLGLEWVRVRVGLLFELGKGLRAGVRNLG